MERGEQRELPERGLDARVDEHRLTKLLTSVDDPVPNGVGVGQPGGECQPELGLVDRGPRGSQLPFGERLIIAAEQR